MHGKLSIVGLNEIAEAFGVLNEVDERGFVRVRLRSPLWTMIHSLYRLIIPALSCPPRDASYDYASEEYDWANQEQRFVCVTTSTGSPYLYDDSTGQYVLIASWDMVSTILGQLTRVIHPHKIE